jgi:hypothetical protein
MVDGRLSQTGARKAQQPEPEVFDIALTVFVVGEEIARDPHLRLGNAVARPEEPQEELHHGGVRVDEPDCVSTSGSLGPEEHAARCVEKVPSLGETPTRFLRFFPTREGNYCICPGAIDPPAHAPPQRQVLGLGELDVTHPKADRRLRDAEEPS